MYCCRCVARSPEEVVRQVEAAQQIDNTHKQVRHTWMGIFKASARWADAFYKSKCPSVCPSVYPSVCVSIHF